MIQDKIGKSEVRCSKAKYLTLIEHKFIRLGYQFPKLNNSFHNLHMFIIQPIYHVDILLN